jgi:hypothetical protein
VEEPPPPPVEVNEELGQEEQKVSWGSLERFRTVRRWSELL